MNNLHSILNFKRLSLAILALLIFSPLYLAQPIKKLATITKISDGDTVWILMAGQEVKLRLLGIDTPEKFDSKKLDNAFQKKKQKLPKNEILRAEKLRAEYFKEKENSK